MKPEKPHQSANKRHAGRGGNNVSLHPLTPDQAMAALLRVNPADVKKLEAEEAAAKEAKR